MSSNPLATTLNSALILIRKFTVHRDNSTSFKQRTGPIVMSSVCDNQHHHHHTSHKTSTASHGPRPVTNVYLIIIRSQVKHTTQSLYAYLNTLHDNKEMLKSICDTIIKVFADNLHVKRITGPMFNFLDRLLSSGMNLVHFRKACNVVVVDKTYDSTWGKTDWLIKEYWILKQNLFRSIFFNRLSI